ncbi:MAG: MerR family transcriptional regulator [Candidatus Riflebacteria bacterium]|nr:MerR family transcriptional regulator [Candidatus Riflebacteria bacterium]
MAEQYSIAEISRLTGLPAHTLRYYEQQFPVLLGIERTRGGHRIYRKHHLDTISRIIRLLKDEKVSIKKARELLGEPNAAGQAEENTQSDSRNEVGGEKNGNLEHMLYLVLERLDLICRNNENRDTLLVKLLKNQPSEHKHELLEQIARCRHETRETIRLCQTVIQRGAKAN